MKSPQIAARVFDTPLLAAPSKAAAFVKGLGPRIVGANRIEFAGVDASTEVPPSNKPYASLLDDRLGDEIRSGKRGAYRIVDGVAVIPITGTLIHRGAWVGSFSGETSYEGIGAQIEAAAADSFVRGIALEIDSHGGEVAGCFDLADRIRAVRKAKPVQSFVCDHANSAAYALASQTEKVIVPRAGGIGSIGVICLHADFSQHLEDMGVRVTVISAGAHKADGNPYEPLPDDVRGALQAEMENLRRIFAETVGEGRGKALTAEAALKTEAACFLGADAVEAGLADEVANPREAFERFVAQVNGRSSSPIIATKEGTDPMSKDTKPEGQETQAEAEAPKADGAAAPEQKEPPKADAPTPAPTADAPDGKTDERQRISAIMNCAEAQGREDLAKSLAFNSGMSAEEAKVHLAAAPKAAPTRNLSQEMDQDETDLDMPAGAGAQENPVKAAVKSRFRD